MIELVRVLVDAGASPAAAARAAAVLDAGGTIAEAKAAMEQAEVFRPETLISRVNGGGGNRTRVSFPADSPLSSENALSSDDEPPREPSVTPGAGA